MRGALVVIAIAILVGAAAPRPPLRPPTATDARPWIVGTWSFDGTCASGYGMKLERDGKAAYDEWGVGLWALDESGPRLIIIAADISEEADRREEAELMEFRITSRSGNAMTLMRLSDGAKIEGKRCGV
jgi:hypothetical protein